MASGAPRTPPRFTAGDTLGCAPKAGILRGASTIVLRTDPTPSISTSTTSPGSTGLDPAGVPVRITSPGSSVMNRDRSATSSPKPNSMFVRRVLLHHLAVDARPEGQCLSVDLVDRARTRRAA